MAEPNIQYGFREDLYVVGLTVEATTPVGVVKAKFPIDKMAGGGIKAKSKKYRPVNGLENEMELGGPRSTDNVTLSTLFSGTTEENLQFLMEYAGRATVSVGKQPVDINGKAYGKVLTYKGRLLEVIPPPTDSQSEKEAVIEFVCSLETGVSVN